MWVRLNPAPQALQGGAGFKHELPDVQSVKVLFAV